MFGAFAAAGLWNDIAVTNWKAVPGAPAENPTADDLEKMLGLQPGRFSLVEENPPENMMVFVICENMTKALLARTMEGQWVDQFGAPWIGPTPVVWHIFPTPPPLL